MRYILPILLLLTSAVGPTNAQVIPDYPLPPNMMKLCIDIKPFDFGKFEGSPQLRKGYHLTPSQKEGVKMMIPCIEKAIKSGQYEAIVLEGEADSTVFVGLQKYEDDSIRQLEVAGARSYVVGRELLRQLNGKYPSAWFRWTVSMGQQERSVRVYGVLKGASLREVERLLKERFDDHENRIKALEGQSVPVLTEEIRRAIREEGSATRAHVSREHDQTRSELRRSAHLMIGLGRYASSNFQNVYLVSMGVRFPRWQSAISLDVLGGKGGYEEKLLHRPYPDIPTTHWRTDYTAFLSFQKYFNVLTEENMEAYILGEIGTGIILSDFDGPSQSIGFYDNGVIEKAGVGVGVRTHRVSLEIKGGMEAYHFPYSDVLPDVADGEFHFGGYGNFLLSFHLGGSE